MHDFKLGFIGCGNMAQAIIKGIIVNGVLPADKIFASDTAKDMASVFCKGNGVNFAVTNEEVCDTCDIIILAIKPQFLKNALLNIYNRLEGKAVLSIVASWTFDMLKETLPKSRILRTIPNTPSSVKEGFTALSLPSDFSEEELSAAEEIFSSIGIVQRIEEKYMDAVTSIGSAGCVYSFLLIDALADAGVREGMPRIKSVEMAAQAVLGGAKLIIESKEHPQALKDKVCSPGGITIEAVKTLENNAFKGIVMDAVASSTRRCKEISEANK